MKLNDPKLPFKEAEKLLRNGSAYYVTIATHTSPLVINFLCSDNCYRTFTVEDNLTQGTSIKSMKKQDRNFCGELLQFIKEQKI